MGRFEEMEPDLYDVPVMALRGISVFPRMILNFDVERPASLAAIDVAGAHGRKVFLVAQRDILKEYPGRRDLYTVGTVCYIRQFIKSQNGGMRVMVEGRERGALLNLYTDREYLRGDVGTMESTSHNRDAVRMEAMTRQLLDLYDSYTSLSGDSVPEAIISLGVKSDPGYVADYVAQNTHLKHEQKQKVLELTDIAKRMQYLSSCLSREIAVTSIEHELNDKLRERMADLQRENILREQLRMIRGELGEDLDGGAESEEYCERIMALKLDKEIEAKLLKEADRLSKQPFGSAEGALLRGYLDMCLELPWNKTTKERINIDQARKILDEDHFGLEKVKERIIEFLAVKQLAPDMKGTILCFVGPPGVGKTSVAMSIARAVNRKLVRMSLGGVHDEAEIRGHRKTYIGAMPGRIMAAINQAGTKNPLLLMDEIDKLGKDFRGDPSSALLEVFDTEQNSTFRDHYLEVPFDISDVLFITTANTTQTIPRPLLDRMEVIELPSYTDEEKLAIAKNYLVPKQRKKHGLTGRTLRIGDEAIREIIACYTKESGVRQLEREIGAVCRKVAVDIAEGKAKSVSVKSRDLEKLLGVRRFKRDTVDLQDQVGVVKGLAWTAVGGEILEAEAIALDGTGKLELTGNLGDVMKESAHAGLSYIRSRTERLGIDREFYKDKDIHVHFPEGAIPKDGPSAGITMTVAMISALTGRPVRRDIAMTGEITLTGRIMAIGGLKEKTMAALRAGIHTVIIPAENERDLEEIDQTVRRGLNFVTTSHIDNILDLVLGDMPAQKEQSEKSEPEKVELVVEQGKDDDRSAVIRQ
ncbi:MAG: endopeptidase La [Oscillospiraceae bacterium]|nr:endopeptidase La [Oscillospiraceae bacterium]